MANSYTFEDVHAQVKDKPHRPFLGFVVVAVIVILIISFQRKEISKIANNLTNSQTLLSIQTPAKDRPVKLAAIGGKALNGISTMTLSTKEVTDRFNILAYSRNDIIEDNKSSTFDVYKKANNTADLLYYVSINSIVGPAGLEKSASLTQTCSPKQQELTPKTAVFVGSMCEIHNSIATVSAVFDHDMDQNTPAINATEEWFLHKKNTDGTRGDRLMHTVKDTKDIVYVINPANFQARQYIIARIKDKLIATNPALNANGVFLATIDLSLANIRALSNVNVNNDIFEFSTFNPVVADAAYSESIFYMIGDIRNALNTYSTPLTLWGKLSGGINNGFEWDRYAGLLNGAMMEHFSMQNGKLFNAQLLENQLVQMQKWQDNGGKVIANVSGKAAQRASDARYGLAAYLLFTNGETSAFQYSEEQLSAGAFMEFPEYYYALGKPTELRQRIPTDKPTFIKYARNFECGRVELQLDETQKENIVPSATITLNNGCQPGVSPTPSLTPSPTKTPTPLPTTTPLPTFTPFPTFTPIPTATPRPLACGWCGNDCVPFDPNRTCIMSVPPSGFDCKAVLVRNIASCQKVKKN